MDHKQLSINFLTPFLMFHTFAFGFLGVSLFGFDFGGVVVWGFFFVWFLMYFLALKLILS